MSRQVGLKNIYVAKVLTDPVGGTTTYEAPIKLERAIKASLKPKAAQSKLYSDDSVEEVLNTFESVDVSIELNQLSLASRALLQGAKVIKGVLVESSDNIPPTVALGFQSKKSNGKYRYVWLYKGVFSMGDDSYESQADKIKDQTASLSATFYARDSDNKYRIIADDDDVNIDTATIAGWFAAVPSQPVGGVITTVTAVAGMTAIITSVTGTVIAAKTGATVAQLKTALQVDAGKGTFRVYSSSTKTANALDVALVTSAMVVEATAEDATTKATYTITVS